MKFFEEKDVTDRSRATWVRGLWGKGSEGERNGGENKTTVLGTGTRDGYKAIVRGGKGFD